MAFQSKYTSLSLTGKLIKVGLLLLSMSILPAQASTDCLQYGDASQGFAFDWIITNYLAKSTQCTHLSMTRFLINWDIAYDNTIDVSYLAYYNNTAGECVSLPGSVKTQYYQNTEIAIPSNLCGLMVTIKNEDSVGSLSFSYSTDSALYLLSNGLLTLLLAGVMASVGFMS